MSTVVTGEAVPLDLRLARFPSRSLGFAVDVVVLAALALGVGWLTGLVVGTLDDAAAAALTLTAVVLVLVGVPATVETLTHGRSLGKLMMGLRVVRDDGGPIRFRHALVRALFGVLADFVLTVGAGAMICSLASSRGKRIGDLAAGTVVVRIATTDPSGPAPSAPPSLRPWAAGLDLSRLDGELALSARTYLLRAGAMTPAVRDDLGARLATQVAGVISPPAPVGTPAWAYLAAVLEERTRRSQGRDRGLHVVPPPSRTPQTTTPPVADATKPPPHGGGFAPPG